MSATAVIIIKEERAPDTAVFSLRIGSRQAEEKRQPPRTKRISDRMLPSMTDWAKAVSP